MKEESFEIFFRKMHVNKNYRAHVHISSHSDNILRLTVTAGAKELLLEKYLFRKTNKWKIKGANFDITGANTKDSAMLIMAIQDAIDKELVSRGF